MPVQVGELAALSCSFLWATCSLAFAVAGRRIGGSAVNQIRIHMALVVLFALHALLIGSPWPTTLSDRQVLGLALSGLAGLALGDLFLFQCMAAIGPRLGTLLMATSPLMTAAIGFLFLGESLSRRALVGMVVLTAGVAMVLLDRKGNERWSAETRVAWPVVAGLLGALGQAVGLVLARGAMLATEPGEQAVAPLSATVVRMVAGALGMVVIAVLAGQVRSTWRATRDGAAMRATAVGMVFGPVLGVWMSQVAVGHAKAGIAAPLMSLAPVLMVPIARFAYGARPGVVGVVGTVAAVAGGVLVVVGGEAA